MPDKKIEYLKLEAYADYDNEGIQGFNIRDVDTNEDIVGSEGIYPYQGEEVAILMAASPKLLEALKYARRFLKKDDVDTDYIDSVISQATTPKNFPEQPED